MCFQALRMNVKGKLTSRKREGEIKNIGARHHGALRSALHPRRIRDSDDDGTHTEGGEILGRSAETLWFQSNRELSIATKSIEDRETLKTCVKFC